MIKKVSVVAAAVKDLDAAVKEYCDMFGFEVRPHPHGDSPEQRTRRFYLKNGIIEIFQPMSPGSPISRFLETRGEGLYSLAFITDNLEEEVKALQAKGAQLIIPPYKGKMTSVFIHPKSTHGVLIHLSEGD